MARTYSVDWVDAFSDRAFGGNGCAVVHDAADVNDATCMAFVRETSLVECTFVEPSTTGDFKVRYFLASREIPFAGHPTIATVASMLSRGMVSGNSLTLETLAGLIAITIDRANFDAPLITMQQIAPVFGVTVPPEIVAPVGGLGVDDIVGQPQIVSTGLPFCITVVKDRATLQKVALNLAALDAYARHLGVQNDVMEPFWVTLEGATAQGRTFSRLLLAPPNPPEDPFTGSATGAMAAYLWANGMIDSPTFAAQQGHDLNRPGIGYVKVLGPCDAMTGVCVAGQGHVLMSGQLHL